MCSRSALRSPTASCSTNRSRRSCRRSREASRTVGSPQIRNAGTLAGNLGTCSPAGDGLPVLAALDATVTLVSAAGVRSMPVGEFMVGVKRTAILTGRADRRDRASRSARGWQGYAKVGVRNAMVIAVASACLVVDRDRRSVALALGSVGPTVLRCPDAEAFLAAEIDWSTMTAPADGGRPLRRAGVGGVEADRRSPLDGGLPAARRRRARVTARPAGGRRRERRSSAPISSSSSRCTSTEPTCPSATRGSARACSTCCATGSGCSARRVRASRASAVRAACWSTAPWSARAS